ncbi:MAG: hypothetical protein KJZ74_06290 [Gemmatimonadales bacterium]|nr:hypothetical protein [Gemmatimonadota bacterium]MCL4213507.1 hypothetical protein [Gemmatimonadales bacterium]
MRGRGAARTLVAGLLGVLLSCEPATRADPFEAWGADIASSGQVLFMGFTRRGEQISGNAELADLLGPRPGELMRVTGTRRGDSLDLTFQRPFGGSYRFVGRYVAGEAGLSGTLDGGAFAQVAISFSR